MIDIGVNFATRTYNRDKIAAALTRFQRRGGIGVISISNSVKEIEINRRLALWSRPVSTDEGNALGTINSVDSCTENVPSCPIYYTAGCHPHCAKDMKPSDFDRIESCFTTPSSVFSASSTTTVTASASVCVAVGEMGLDYNRMFSPKEVQQDVFRRQIRIAKKYGKPMYCHVRDAFEDFVSIIAEEEYSHGVVHCFTGNLTQAEILIGQGFKLGITGWLMDSRRNEDLVEVVSSSRVPMESLMVETDAPYMSIIKHKKRLAKEGIILPGLAVGGDSAAGGSEDVSSHDRNQNRKRSRSNESTPEDIEYVLMEIARLKGLTVEQCRATALQTTKLLFQL